MSTPTPDEPLKPVILDGHAESFTPAPTLPGQMIMRPVSPTHAAVRGGLAAILAAGGVVNLVYGGMFPHNAPVESIIMFFLSVGLFIGAVVLAVFAILAAIRRSVPVSPNRTSPLSFAAIILSGVAFVGWALFGLPQLIGSLRIGGTLRYMDNVGSLLILVAPWILGMVFGAIALRSGGRRTALFSGIAIGLGLVLLAVLLTSTILYGLGLTN
jgi:hypothetical protein